MDQLSQRRGRLVEALLDEVGPEVAAGSLARAASEVLGIDSATINVADPNRGVSLVGHHGSLGEELELLQRRVSDGPTLAALEHDRPVICLEPESCSTRWPDFGSEAAARGITALFSLPLRPRGGNPTALGLYATDHASFDQPRIGDVLLVADLLAEALANPVLDGLDGRLRHVGDDTSAVHRATGILVARLGLTPAQALSSLRSEAASTRTPLATIAAQVIHGGSAGAPV